MSRWQKFKMKMKGEHAICAVCGADIYDETLPDRRDLGTRDDEIWCESCLRGDDESEDREVVGECSQCEGNRYADDGGQCLHCGRWDSIEAEIGEDIADESDSTDDSDLFALDAVAFGGDGQPTFTCDECGVVVDMGEDLNESGDDILCDDCALLPVGGSDDDDDEYFEDDEDF